MEERTIKLANGVKMPMLGLGTYPMMGEQLQNAIISAYNVGYRLIDTSDSYYNETDIGESLHLLYGKTDAKRGNMFIVTKVSDELYHPKSVVRGRSKGIYFWNSSPIMQKPNAVHDIVNMRINNSLKNLRTDYIDLYLMHWPYPDCFPEIWYEMEQLLKIGKVRAIGVCNFRERHLKMLEDSDVFPMVDQFETSPLNTKCSLANYCRKHNVQIMVYSPLMHLRFKHHQAYIDYVNCLAKKYNRDKAQIVLRYNVQRGFVPIPKSSHQKRLASNISSLDFQLTEDEMKKLLSFNSNMQTLPESKSCPGI